jgi:L-amino acid N-acyltransferase YncA
MGSASVIVRAATLADTPALAAIHGHHVLHGSGTFEEVPPSADEMGRRLMAVLDRGLPYLIADIDGHVAGLAYAAPFRMRAAYRYTVEDSVYVAPEHLGAGLGKALLSRVIEAAEALDLRQMVAVIGDSGNTASIGLHRSCGFQPAGVLPGVGFKSGRWVDVVMMRRRLNTGADGPPTVAGLRLSEA